MVRRSCTGRPGKASPSSSSRRVPAAPNPSPSLCPAPTSWRFLPRESSLSCSAAISSTAGRAAVRSPECRCREMRRARLWRTCSRRTGPPTAPTWLSSASSARECASSIRSGIPSTRPPDGLAPHVCLRRATPSLSSNIPCAATTPDLSSSWIAPARGRLSRAPGTACRGLHGLPTTGRSGSRRRPRLWSDRFDR